MELRGVRSLEQLQQACREQIEEALQRKQLERQSQWSESLAMGSPAYVEAVRLGSAYPDLSGCAL